MGDRICWPIGSSSAAGRPWPPMTRDSPEQLARDHRRHLDFLRSCRLFFETERHFLVHANYQANLPLDLQPRQVMLWPSLKDRQPGPHCSGKLAVVGHTAQKNGEILDLGYLKCIDTCCYGDGWLTAMELETGRLWQADKEGKLEALAAARPGRRSRPAFFLAPGPWPLAPLYSPHGESIAGNRLPGPAAEISPAANVRGFWRRGVLAAAGDRKAAGSCVGGRGGRFLAHHVRRPQRGCRDVLAEVATMAMFGGQRLVVVEEADELVSRYRAELEDYVARPCASGILTLEMTTGKAWSSGTRLYKAVAADGLAIDCNVPAAAQLARWLGGWARQTHRVELSPAAAEMLIESIGPELGLIDQELAKLALAAGIDGKITPEMVRRMVGTWRTKTTWDMLDAALDGNVGQAIEQLDRLLASGENPVGLLAQISASLRRFGAATRLVLQAEAGGRRIALRQALEEAGISLLCWARPSGSFAVSAGSGAASFTAGSWRPIWTSKARARSRRAMSWSG